MSKRQEETTSPEAVEAAPSPTGCNGIGMEQTRKIVVSEQIASAYGFQQGAAEEVEAVCADVQSAVKFIIENGTAKDQCGSVLPKDDCPHIYAHVLISTKDIPEHPQGTGCSVAQADAWEATKASTERILGQGQPKPEDPNGDCPTGENWLCLECGIVSCSQYGNGHNLTHLAGRSGGHCIAAGLSDLSAWCYECESYVRDPLLDPILQKLEQLKFCYVKLEGPQLKKFRLGAEATADEAETLHDNSDKEEGEMDEGGGRTDIIDVARSVARGVSYELCRSEDETDLEYPFGRLPTSLEDVANFILSEKCRNIVILAGAGMSRSAGIPDFRSADGLYATMNPDLLSCNPIERDSIRNDPTVALEQGMFLQNPLPCLELNREFILGTHNQKWKATLAHRFVELLHVKTGKLVRLYTQNIDGLEDQCTQLPRNKVIAVHGSMDRSECARCGAESDYPQFCSLVQSQIKDLSGKDDTAPQKSTPISCMDCGENTVKPAIVLFRSSLPITFFENVPRDILEVDLLIVIGTSLRVAPANSLVWRVPKTALRLLVNREPVGWHLGMTHGEDSTRDVFAQGSCDSVLLELMAHLGWLKDLEPLLRESKLPASSVSLLTKQLQRRFPAWENRESS